MRDALKIGFLCLPAAILLAAPSEAHAQSNVASGQAMLTAPMTLSLDEVNGSGMSGTVTLTPRGDSTVVELTLNGARAGESVQSHIHFGTCQAPGGVVAPLHSVQIGSDGSGTSRTTVLRHQLDAARTEHGSLLVQAHSANMRPAACADVPAR